MGGSAVPGGSGRCHSSRSPGLQSEASRESQSCRVTAEAVPNARSAGAGGDLHASTCILYFIRAFLCILVSQPSWLPGSLQTLPMASGAHASVSRNLELSQRVLSGADTADRAGVCGFTKRFIFSALQWQFKGTVQNASCPWPSRYGGKRPCPWRAALIPTGHPWAGASSQSQRFISSSASLSVCIDVYNNLLSWRVC